ncbi:MAG: D-alanyl-D-alanine carboxypeptidase family protein, partial [Aquisalinus sp.]|nr:D-alanyl-D-alanine carboxypeptidase family protein [Aquisalinus sp.]
DLYRDVLASRLATRLELAERRNIKKHVADLELGLGQSVNAAGIYAEFLDIAGDEAARQKPRFPGSMEASYVLLVQAAMDSFAEALPPVHDEDITSGSESEKLQAATDLAKLGGYYAAQDGGNYAAAGLLSAAYRTRLTLLGPAHPDTLHTALLLGPIYQDIQRHKEAEELYLSAFHAQERARGSNNPDLSLYIRLLADVYKKQGRFTEAEALNTHIQRLFKDAFGARRYVTNKLRDRRMDINRPVSAAFPLSDEYIPDDLVKAEGFDVPLSKNSDLAEMSVRMATELDEDNDVGLPVALAALIKACQTSDNEMLTLRSGYRSFSTQKDLYGRIGYRGTVTQPGMSEHQLGLAVDIDVNRRLMRQTDRAYQCFEENAWRHGFILSYPPGNNYLPGEDTYEPWHWRYVGKRTALLYREAGPINKPQEFLAALPCYEERAMAGIWSIAEEQDVCLEGVNVNVSASTDPVSLKTGENIYYDNNSVVPSD